MNAGKEIHRRGFNQSVSQTVRKWLFDGWVNTGVLDEGLHSKQSVMSDREKLIDMGFEAEKV